MDEERAGLLQLPATDELSDSDRADSVATGPRREIEAGHSMAPFGRPGLLALLRTFTLPLSLAQLLKSTCDDGTYFFF